MSFKCLLSISSLQTTEFSSDYSHLPKSLGSSICLCILPALKIHFIFNFNFYISFFIVVIKYYKLGETKSRTWGRKLKAEPNQRQWRKAASWLALSMVCFLCLFLQLRMTCTGHWTIHSSCIFPYQLSIMKIPCGLVYRPVWLKHIPPWSFLYPGLCQVKKN